VDSAATISYTTDGTDPAFSSTVKTCSPGTAIAITASETVNARAANAGSDYAQSAVASAAYSIPAAPAISGASGTSATYSLGFADSRPPLPPAAAQPIYYTTDGSTPSPTNGTHYTSAFNAVQTETVKPSTLSMVHRAPWLRRPLPSLRQRPDLRRASGGTIAANSGVTSAMPIRKPRSTTP